MDKKAMNRYMSRADDPAIRMGKKENVPIAVYEELARVNWRAARDRWQAAAAIEYAPTD